MHSIKRDGRFVWAAEGKIDDEIMRVTLYGEHRRAIDEAGYKVMWDLPQVAVIDSPTVALIESNGRRRVAFALKLGTEDEWIEVKQK